MTSIFLQAAAEVDEPLTADTVGGEIRQLGRQAIGIVADVTCEDAIEEMFKEVFATFAQVDILINNAGGGRGGSRVTTCSMAAWEAILDKNLNRRFSVAVPLHRICVSADAVKLSTSPRSPA
ncbi:hypothetical protein NKDENANG_02049 [Candidatus Entotheonellaceae bacterium PAL068K]